MHRWFRFSRIEKLIVELIVLIALVIEGYRFIRFELGIDQPKQEQPQVGAPKVRKQTTEPSPTLLFIFASGGLDAHPSFRGMGANLYRSTDPLSSKVAGSADFQAQIFRVCN